MISEACTKIDDPMIVPTTRAVAAGLSYVTEDRKATGHALKQSIAANALGVVRPVFPARTSTARAALPGLPGRPPFR